MQGAAVTAPTGEVERVAAVPLVELLEAIPADARLVWTEPDGLKATHYVPVGKYAHDAAAMLRSLEKDAERLDWIEARLTLHSDVEMLYVVDGYEVQHVINDGATVMASGHGDHLRAAIDRAIEAAGRTEGGGG
jgi:hypothetical protein